MINIFNPFDERYFNKKLIANKEDKNVVTRPTKRGRKPNEAKSLKEEINSTIAAYQGWKDYRNQDSKKIQFGDGSDISEESMDDVCEIAEKITHDHFWQKGDLLLVDNFLVMHGRRPFFGTRKVLASLSL